MEIESIVTAMLEKATENLEDETHASYLIQEKTFWETLLTKNVANSLETSPILSSSEMSFTMKHFMELKDWLGEFGKNMELIKKEPKAPKAPIDLSLSSGTPKKRKLDISTFTTPVSTANPTVDAYFSKISKTSSVGILEGLLQSTPLKPKTGHVGCNIFLNHQGTSYTYKSPTFPSGEMYLSLNVCDNPSDMRKETVSNAWKTQSFRSKIVVGRVHPQSQKRFKEIKKLVEKLEILLIQEAKDFPDLVESQE